jgi:GTP-binding protein EngB required for normal cell division
MNYTLVASLFFVSCSLLGFSSEFSKQMFDIQASCGQEVAENRVKFLSERMDELTGGAVDFDLYMQVKSLLSNSKSTKEFEDFCDILRALERRYPLIDEVTSLKIQNFLNDFFAGQKLVKNILVVGRSRGGKSTFMSTIINPLDAKLHALIAQAGSISHTVDITPYFIAFESANGDIYVARIIDSPGLLEVKAEDSEMVARSDKEIIRHIIAGIKDLGINIDQVITIVGGSVAGGLIEADFSSLQFLTKSLNEDIFSEECTIALIIAKIDLLGSEEFEAIKEGMSRNLKNKKMDSYSIYGTGLIFGQDFHNGMKDKALDSALCVMQHRNKVLKAIFNVSFAEGLSVDDNDRKVLSDEFLEEFVPLLEIQEKLRKQNDNRPKRVFKKVTK